MRKVVSNTTPILSLLKIGQLPLLQTLYQRVIVPEAVWLEIEAGKDKVFYTDLKTIPWFEVQTISNAAAIDYLTDLDKGEAEVIILAREIAADLVIIDETLGRQYARHFELTYTGMLGILLRAKKEGHLTVVKPLLHQLRENGVWISDQIFYEILQMAEEI